jgi:methionyl-tRNA synthetase
MDIKQNSITNPDNVLITTAISYVNGEPHIGHMYEMILADFVKKWHQITGSVTKLLTGTDEHGKKIQQIAEKNKLNPIALCDLNSAKFTDLANCLQMSYDYFIRTTLPIHKDVVKNAIVKSAYNSDIYLSNYEGYYSIREETFLSEADAKLTDYKDPLTSISYEYIKEPSYYFALGSYANFLIQHLNENQPIVPSELNNQMIAKIDESKLKDLSISRTTFNWGIEFPEITNIIRNLNSKHDINTNVLTDNESKHIVYVWFDALLNYYTGQNILYGFDELIQPNKLIHIIGKDILWFHSIIYPAILKSINQNSYIANKILVHGFIVDSQGVKMSKSLNNVIYPSELLEEYPIEAIRYYLLMETDLNSDIRFNKSELKSKYNNVLIKDYGNLIQRIFCLLKPCQNEFNQYMFDAKLFITKPDPNINLFLQSYDIKSYQTYLLKLLSDANKKLNIDKPWLLKNDFELDVKLNSLYPIFDLSLRASIMLYPIIGDKISEILLYFGIKLDLNPDSNTYIYNQNRINISLDKIKVFDLI